MKTVMFVTVGLITLSTGCVGAKPAPPPVQNSNITASNTSGNTMPKPWPNLDVFTDETQSINVTIGQGFVIKYDFFNSISSTFQVDYQPTNVVNLIETQLSKKPLELDGTEWFLFQAAAVGTTYVTIGERGHLMPTGFVSQKTFTINVVPPRLNISGNLTGNPWPDIEVFTNLFTNQNPSLNVTVGQEFVIPYNQFTSSNITFQPANVVIVESKQFVQNPGVIIPDGTTWILFKAVAAGNTKVSVTETTRFGDPMQTKTLTINVSPATPNPVLVVSVAMTGPINPGGPVVEVILRNASSQSIVSLNATLVLLTSVLVQGPNETVPRPVTLSQPFVFNFAAPVLQRATASSKLILIGGGLSTQAYPLTISGTMQDGHNFTFTTQVNIQ